MWAAVLKFLGQVAIYILGAIVAKKLGKSEAKQEQADANGEGRKDDAKIASKPFTPNPFSRMRPRKK